MFFFSICKSPPTPCLSDTFLCFYLQGIHSLLVFVLLLPPLLFCFVFLLINALLSPRHFTVRASLMSVSLLLSGCREKRLRNVIMPCSETTARPLLLLEIETHYGHELVSRFSEFSRLFLTFFKGQRCIVVSDVCTFLAKNVGTTKHL